MDNKLEPTLSDAELDALDFFGSELEGLLATATATATAPAASHQTYVSVTPSSASASSAAGSSGQSSLGTSSFFSPHSAEIDGTASGAKKQKTLSQQERLALRKAKNKASAVVFRIKQKQKVAALEEEKQTLLNELQVLREANTALLLENAVLKTEVQQAKHSDQGQMQA